MFSVLNQVRNFLPKMAAANEDLKLRLETDPDYSADIEQLEDSDSPYIQMVCLKNSCFYNFNFLQQ